MTFCFKKNYHFVTKSEAPSLKKDAGNSVGRGASPAASSATAFDRLRLFEAAVALPLWHRQLRLRLRRFLRQGEDPLVVEEELQAAQEELRGHDVEIEGELADAESHVGI